MNRQFVKDAFGWGFVLWFIGYALGIVLFALVPAGLIGWFITPVGIVITLWVAFKKLKGNTLPYYGLLALAWLLIAVIGDYLFIVKALKRLLPRHPSTSAQVWLNVSPMSLDCSVTLVPGPHPHAG